LEYIGSEVGGWALAAIQERSFARITEPLILEEKEAEESPEPPGEVWR
jgi:hypothetical protein